MIFKNKLLGLQLSFYGCWQSLKRPKGCPRLAPSPQVDLPFLSACYFAVVALQVSLQGGHLLSEVVAVIIGIVVVRVDGGVAGVLVIFRDFFDLSVGV